MLLIIQGGDNAMTLASRYGHIACVELLLKAGVDPNQSSRVCIIII